MKELIELVGKEWMQHVEAVAMDRNSDFQEAFKAECGWIQIVYDHFHIVKNFNDKVIAEVRKEEQIRLKKEGLVEEAAVLKGSRKILCANRESLQKHDQEAREGKICRRGSTIFHTTDYKHTHDDFEQRYDGIIKSNKLLYHLRSHQAGDKGGICFGEPGDDDREVYRYHRLVQGHEK